MNLIKMDLTDLSVAELLTTLKALGTAITGKPAFTSITAKITAFNTKVTALDTANTTYENAVSTADTKLTLRGNARVDAENAARDLATAAEGVTSDPATLEDGGFVLRAKGSPVGPMPQPAAAAATIGDLEGTVDFHWNAIKRGVTSYIAEYATSPSGPWTQFYVNKASSCTATGLTSGTQYWFRVRAVGAAGPGPWSDPATCRAA
jgi:hypothetical protein